VPRAVHDADHLRSLRPAYQTLSPALGAAPYGNPVASGISRP
jgi:hypothetical protein